MNPNYRRLLSERTPDEYLTLRLSAGEMGYLRSYHSVNGVNMKQTVRVKRPPMMVGDPVQGVGAPKSKPANPLPKGAAALRSSAASRGR